MRTGPSKLKYAPFISAVEFHGTLINTEPLQLICWKSPKQQKNKNIISFKIKIYEICLWPLLIIKFDSKLAHDLFYGNTVKQALTTTAGLYTHVMSSNSVTSLLSKQL